MKKTLSSEKMHLFSGIRLVFTLIILTCIPFILNAATSPADGTDTTGSEFLFVKEVIQVNYEKAVVWHNQALTDLEKGNFRQAVGKLEMSIKFFDEYQDMDLVYYHYFQALICFNTDSSLQRALWLDKNGFIKASSGRFINSYRGTLHFLLGNTDKARASYHRATTDNPSVPEVYYDAAIFNYFDGQMKEALSYVCEAIRLDPSNSEAKMLKARILMQMNEPMLAYDAISDIQNQMFSDAKNACLFMNLLVINRKPGFEMNEKFGNLIRFGNKFGVYERIALGNAYYSDDNYDDAIRYYKEAWNLDQNNYMTAYNIGNVFFMQGYYNEAEKWYQNALIIEPSSIQVRLALAQLYRNNGNDKSAFQKIQGLENVIPQKMTNYEIFNFLGDVYLQNRYYSDALQCFKIAKSIDAKRADAWAGLALVFYNQNHYDSAMIYVQKALYFEQENKELLLLESTIIFYRGYYYNTKSEQYYTRAIDNLRKIIKEDPSNTTAMNVLMLIYKEMNMEEEASEMFEEFTRSSTVDWILHNTMIHIEIANGNFKNLYGDSVNAQLKYNVALNHAFNAYEKSDSLWFVLNNIGATYTYLDSFSFALRYLQSIYQTSVVQNNIAIVYALEGDTLKAIEAFEEIYRNDSTAWYARENGKILNGEYSGYFVGKTHRKNSIQTQPGLIRMFYFDFDVQYTMNLPLKPAFEMHDPEISSPVSDGLNIPLFTYKNPNKYNRMEQIIYY